MAKYFGISGKRLGSVGNETYDIVNRQNIVKTKVIDPRYSNTKKQVAQRAKFLDCFNMVKTIGSNYMEKAFNNRKRKESVYNVFMKNNVGQALMISPNDNEDPNMIGFGDFLVSKGNLQNLDYTIADSAPGFFNVNILKLFSSSKTTKPLSANVSVEALSILKFLYVLIKSILSVTEIGSPSSSEYFKIALEIFFL